MATDPTRKDFLDAIFRPYYSQYKGFLTVRTSDPNGEKIATRYFPHSDGLSREQYSSDMNVYFGVCPREKMKPGKEHVRYITCLWAGIDIGPFGYSGKDKHFHSEKQALVAMTAFPLKPSIVVKSGRGFHLYWLLKSVTEIDDPAGTEQLLNRIGNYFQCSTPSGLDAFLRLPDTWNCKDSVQSLKCLLLQIDPNLRYELEDFEDLDLRIVIPSTRAPRMPQVNLPTPVRIVYVDSGSNGPETAMRSDQVPEESSHEDGDTRAPEIYEEVRTVALDHQTMEKMVDLMMERFSEEVLDRLADRVAQRVLRGLLNTGG